MRLRIGLWFRSNWRTAISGRTEYELRSLWFRLAHLNSPSIRSTHLISDADHSLHRWRKITDFRFRYAFSRLALALADKQRNFTYVQLKVQLLVQLFNTFVPRLPVVFPYHVATLVVRRRQENSNTTERRRILIGNKLIIISNQLLLALLPLLLHNPTVKTNTWMKL